VRRDQPAVFGVDDYTVRLASDQICGLNGPMHRSVRTSRESDVPEILALIQDLASYEREPDAVKITVDQLRSALFGDPAAAYALVAEVDGEVAGFALYFLNFSTWEGVSGIYLEDLYVRPEHRGLGLGQALLTGLAEMAVSRGYARVEWSVLDWNQPAIDFYRRMGAIPMDDWTVYRLTGDQLRRAAGAG